MIRHIIILLLIPLATFAQTPGDQINTLKNSFLLVRLKTSEKKIQAAQDAGLNDFANEIRENQRAENEEITQAFADKFDFCPVYFFYSNCSKQVLEHDFEGCLMGSNLKPLQEIPRIDDFFIAEFDYVKKSEDQYFSHYSIEYDTAGYKEFSPNYYGGTETGPDALVMMDSRFHQLTHPFPFYVRTYQGFSLLKRSKENTVRLFNKKLTDYYIKK